MSQQTAKFFMGCVESGRVVVAPPGAERSFDLPLTALQEDVDFFQTMLDSSTYLQVCGVFRVCIF